MQYRAEIDGLRSFAVVPVVLFHADMPGFGGGYVGVDVFFVISGYLITTILISEIEAGQFSLLRFYERRARRILPALFFVMLCCIPVATQLLTPSDLKDFAQSLVAVSLFSSNILFWQESGYFGAASELKPLLHTWSLSVEEQFYLFFPLLLLMLWRVGLGKLCLLLSLLAVGSFALAVWMVPRAPDAAFYLVVTRGWELLIGALCAFALRYGSLTLPKPIGQSIALLGFGLIVSAVFLFNARSPFPGVPALVPTLGAALVILCARHGTLVQKALSQPPCVAIGLLSYSIYLWHQPLLAFAKYQHAGHLPLWYMAVLCLVTLPLAYLTWRYIERPFRRRGEGGMSRGQVFATTGLATAGFIALGSSGHMTNGFQQLVFDHRLTPQQSQQYAQILDATDYDLSAMVFDDGACRFWAPEIDEATVARAQGCARQFGPGIVVLGDSHAINLYNAIARTERAPFVMGAVREACRPHDTGFGCQYDAFEAFAAAYPTLIGEILYHQSGSYFIADAQGNVDSQRAFDEGTYTFQTESISEVASYLSTLNAQSGALITWIGPFREYRHQPRHAIFQQDQALMHPKSRDIFDQLDLVLTDQLHNAAGFEFVPFDQIYAVPENAFGQGCFRYRDGDHFSRCGEREMSQAQSLHLFLSRSLGRSN